MPKQNLSGEKRAENARNWGCEAKSPPYLPSGWYLTHTRPPTRKIFQVSLEAMATIRTCAERGLKNVQQKKGPNSRCISLLGSAHFLIFQILYLNLIFHNNCYIFPNLNQIVCFRFRLADVLVVCFAIVSGKVVSVCAESLIIDRGIVLRLCIDRSMITVSRHWSAAILLPGPVSGSRKLCSLRCLSRRSADRSNSDDL